jgi:hypothetical protein
MGKELLHHCPDKGYCALQKKHFYVMIDRVKQRFVSLSFILTLTNSLHKTFYITPCK